MRISIETIIGLVISIVVLHFNIEITAQITITPRVSLPGLMIMETNFPQAPIFIKLNMKVAGKHRRATLP